MPTDSEAAPLMANHQDLNQFLLNGAHILCSQEEWLWDGDDNNRLIFHADGTGEMISRAEAIVKIVAGIQWKLLPGAGRVPIPARETTVIPPDHMHWRDILRQRTRRKEPTTLFVGILELTITKRRPLLYGSVVHNQINEEVLLDSAFNTRRIDIIVENGDPGVRPRLPLWRAQRHRADIWIPPDFQHFTLSSD
ncbi:hypothetical protein C8F04DRAFT_1231149 [Mycena alexandri]|uniref:Uncharacterized protein n=1 Tax=Mycena alexandri TaxID=1745969 RepID=A0AAD6T928_9AGAR|nr:hypothetical protein C8F04DRAFT_1231149 [Mycena alexandri]